MEYSFIIEPAVRIELIEAVEFYGALSIELGESLLKAFYTEIDSILLNPYLYPVLSKSYRKSSLKRFPYKIVFQVTHAEIIIVAFAHHKRKPNYWKKRS
jgi:toxin ParE1/3/4